ncbi:MAG: CCA tRNA nucleotidyltransferase, partial [Pseudomonadota bacterium]
HRDGLKNIAAERIWKELEKLLRAPAPAKSILSMEEAGVLPVILPDAAAGRFEAFLEVVDAPWDPMRRLMALLPRNELAAARTANALRLSNAERDRLMAWAAETVSLSPDLSPAQARAAAYRLEHRTFFDRVYTAMATDGRARWTDVHDAVDGWGRPSFPVSGGDIAATGRRGPAVGEAMRALEMIWIDSDFTLSREALLGQLSKGL